jgi:SHS family lactate transporter-like MFS transporter
MMTGVSHGTQDMYPTFLQKQRGFTPRQAALIAIVYNVGAILGGLAFGYYSDRVGRRRSMVTALLLGILAIPLWVYAPTTALLVAGAFALQVMVQGAWGVVPAHLNELSPDSVRGFLPGFAYQCGVLLASSVTYVEAVLAHRFSYASAMAMTALLVFSLAALVISLGGEKHGIEFGDSGREIRAS